MLGADAGNKALQDSRWHRLPSNGGSLGGVYVAVSLLGCADPPQTGLARVPWASFQDCISTCTGVCPERCRIQHAFHSSRARALRNRSHRCYRSRPSHADTTTDGCFTCRGLAGTTSASTTAAIAHSCYRQLQLKAWTGQRSRRC